MVVRPHPCPSHSHSTRVHSTRSHAKYVRRVRLHAQIVGGGRVFYRAAGGAVRCIARGALEAAVRDGQVAADTPVFDTSLTTLGEWRERFEQPARESWVAKLAPVS